MLSGANGAYVQTSFWAGHAMIMVTGFEGPLAEKGSHGLPKAYVKFRASCRMNLWSIE